MVVAANSRLSSVISSVWIGSVELLYFSSIELRIPWESQSFFVSLLLSVIRSFMSLALSGFSWIALASCIKYWFASTNMSSGCVSGWGVCGGGVKLYNNLLLSFKHLISVSACTVAHTTKLNSTEIWKWEAASLIINPASPVPFQCLR